MVEENLIEFFFDHYTTREETMYRLPFGRSIDSFWEEELNYRKERAVKLPLHSWDGKEYFYVQTADFLAAADSITKMARYAFPNPDFKEGFNENLVDEAYFSSAIEGAFSTREKAHALIGSGKEPVNKDERMILNNYHALQFVMENLDYGINEGAIIHIGELLTEGTEDASFTSGYRNGPVYILSPIGEKIYTAPDAKYVRPMMDELLDYLNDRSVHPIEKAVIAHVFFVTVHPFFDGNGRTARALTYSILLKAGYDFFRLVPISGILSQERSRYYKTLRACQDPENGYDFTYFSNFYAGCLSRTIHSVQARLCGMEFYRNISGKLDPEKDARILKGAYWMVSNDIKTISAEKWKNKFGISFETARKNLLTLEEIGFFKKRTEGHKVFFDIPIF